MVRSETYTCLVRRLFKVCLNTGYLTAPTRLTQVSVVMTPAGCQLRNKRRIKQKHRLNITEGLLGKHANQRTPSDTTLRGNLRTSDIYPLSLFSRVSHSGKCWLCSYDAQQPHGRLFIVGWRRCLTQAPGRILSWSHLCPAARQLWMLLLRKQVYVDIAWIWNDPPWRPKSRYANDLTFQKPGKQYQLPDAWCVKQTLTHMFVDDIMMPCAPECVGARVSICITRNSQSQSDLYCLVNILQVQSALCGQV